MMYACSQVKPKIFWTYMKAIGPLVSVLIVVFYMMNHGCSVCANFWLSAWSNDAENATVFMEQRDMRLGVYAAFGFGQGLLTVDLLTSFFSTTPRDWLGRTSPK